MKGSTYCAWLLYGVVLGILSCDTMRKRAESREQFRYAYAQSAFASDSTVRYWYFASDSAFTYHPDSGLHTFSGKLLGWEMGVNHQGEQHVWGSARSSQHEEMEVTWDSRGVWPPWYVVLIVLGLILFMVLFNFGRGFFTR